MLRKKITFAIGILVIGFFVTPFYAHAGFGGGGQSDPPPPPPAPFGTGAIVQDGSTPTVPFQACTGGNSRCQWAWNDVVGWIDFYGGTSGPIAVTDTGLTKVASSSVGNIIMSCDPPTGGGCAGAPGNWRVTNSASNGYGNLAGWAWNDAIGWISFCGNATGGSTYDIPSTSWVCPSNPTYQVKISGTSGVFSGWAWNDIVGWISFNCTNAGASCAIPYKVEEANWGTQLPSNEELNSRVFDTCPTGINCGANINSIEWHGNDPDMTNCNAQGYSNCFANNYVYFEIAASDCPNGASNAPTCDFGTWTFTNQLGPVGPGITLPVNFQATQNKRYFRYKVFMIPDPSNTTSPKIDDINIIWSP